MSAKPGVAASKHLAGTHRGAVHVAFAAIRLTKGREWIDLDTLAGFRSGAEEKAAKPVGNSMMIAWDRANPVIRIAEVTVREVSEVVEVQSQEPACYRSTGPSRARVQS